MLGQTNCLEAKTGDNPSDEAILKQLDRGANFRQNSILNTGVLDHVKEAYAYPNKSRCVSCFGCPCEPYAQFFWNGYGWDDGLLRSQ
jgi:hypothetical protein